MLMSFFKQKRKQIRKALMYYLEVLDMDTGLSIGRLVDITTEGVLLVGEKRLEVYSRFNLKIILPETLDGHEYIPFVGRCVRSEKDPHSRYFYSGFQFETIDPLYAHTIELLIFGYEF